MPKFIQPSLFRKQSRSIADVFMGGRRRQRKVHSGGVRKVQRRYTVMGDSWARKQTVGRRIF